MPRPKSSRWQTRSSSRSTPSSLPSRDFTTSSGCSSARALICTWRLTAVLCGSRLSQSFLPPHRQPYLITKVSDRIGTKSIPIDPAKVVAIIESDAPDNTGGNAPADATSQAIADHIIEFLTGEVDAGRIPKSLLPLQSGIGNIANAVIGGLAQGPFDKVNVWTEVLQDTFLEFFDSNKLDFATATSIRFSPEGFEKVRPFGTATTLLVARG